MPVSKAWNGFFPYIILFNILITAVLFDEKLDEMLVISIYKHFVIIKRGKVMKVSYVADFFTVT